MDLSFLLINYNAMPRPLRLAITGGASAVFNFTDGPAANQNPLILIATGIVRINDVLGIN